MKPGEWHYIGDVNIEHGGYFLKLEDEGDDYLLCVEVVDWSQAGGPENVFLVESGSLYLGGTGFYSALDCIGFDEYGPPDLTTTAYALKAYWGLDVDTSRFVQVGKRDYLRDRYDSEPEIDQYLSPRTDLRAYVEEKFLD